MTVLATGRDAHKHDNDSNVGVVVSGDTVFHGGAVGIKPADGFIYPMGVHATLRCLGCARATVVGDGSLKVEIEEGSFEFANSLTTDLITTADIGSIAYAVDDQTAAKTDGSASRAPLGKIRKVLANGRVVVACGIGRGLVL
jgi:hypothetical protein